MTNSEKSYALFTRYDSSHAGAGGVCMFSTFNLQIFLRHHRSSGTYSLQFQGSQELRRYHSHCPRPRSRPCRYAPCPANQYVDPLCPTQNISPVLGAGWRRPQGRRRRRQRQSSSAATDPRPSPSVVDRRRWGGRAPYARPPRARPVGGGEGERQGRGGGEGRRRREKELPANR